MNRSGKVFTVFLIIIAILLVSLTSVSLYINRQETQKRILAEAALEKSRANEAKLETEVKDFKKQNFLLQEKNKEADDKINGLLDELELQKGLREEMKKENLSLKEELDEATRVKGKLQQQLSDAALNSQQLDDSLKTKTQTSSGLNAQPAGNPEKAQPVANQSKDAIHDKKSSAPKVDVVKKDPPLAPQVVEPLEDAPSVNLEDIVVAPRESDGRILSVDTDTEFVVINLGEKNGVQMGDILSVVRGKDYLGDIKVTRVQPEMSAADFIPPFSSRIVRKNDQVITKQE